MNHRSIISLWPKTADLARDLGFPAEQYVNVYSWKRRGRIPPEYWPAVIEAAQARHYNAVTQDALMAGVSPRAARRTVAA